MNTHEQAASLPPGPLTPALFAAFLERCQRPLFTFLGGMVENDEQALDLMQDTFFEAWRVAQRNAPPFDGGRDERELRRWLFHVAYHRTISALRHQRVIRWQSLDADFPEESVADAPFEDTVIEMQAMQLALTELAPPDVACLLLIVVHGFTAAEAGQIIGATAAAVAKRFSRAKQRLREVYLAQNPSEVERMRL